ncbi:MAG TPA: methyltransferase domain-containing protein [Candidatus Binatia bacterium]|jgi:ubiquinone/menaquinone biosynthesis C-methylase UbiE
MSEAFKDFERTGWESVVDEYAGAFGELTAQSIGPLLDAVDAGPGVRLLDVASGPGYVAGAAAERGASVTGVDFSAPMVAAAAQRYSKANFRHGDAEALPFAEGSFDAVTMNFGLLHLGDPDKALAEACRVLRPGGSFAFTVWAKPEETAGFGITLGAILTHGNMHVALPDGPPFFRFSDWAESTRSLVAAGFMNVRLKKISQTWSLASVDALFQAMQTATVRTAGLLRHQKPEALRSIRVMMGNASGLYQRNGAVELPMPAILAAAKKPGAPKEASR